MSRSLAILVCLVLIASASWASAGCVGVYGANSWEILDPNSLLIYDFKRPLVILKTPWCNIFRLSDICLTEALLCTGDKIFVDNQTCEIRELIPIDLNVDYIPQQVATLTLYTKGYTEFSQDEFRRTHSAKALLDEIYKDDYGLNLRSPDDTVARLNEILRVPDFYDRVVKKGKRPKMGNHGQQLAESTKTFRSRNYSDLDEEQQMDISHLNRLVLESLYPAACPKGYLKACPNRISQQVTH